MTLKEIIETHPHFVKTAVRRISDGMVKTLDSIHNGEVCFTDGVKAPEDESGWEVIPPTKLRGAEKMDAKRDSIRSILNEFEGENDDNIVDGVWPQTYIGEMLTDPVLNQMIGLSITTSITTMRNLFSTINTNATWMTQERKDKYLNMFNEAIAVYE